MRYLEDEEDIENIIWSPYDCSDYDINDIKDRL
jgi:hypothetical protein